MKEPEIAICQKFEPLKLLLCQFALKKKTMSFTSSNSERTVWRNEQIALVLILRELATKLQHAATVEMWNLGVLSYLLWGLLMACKQRLFDLLLEGICVRHSQKDFVSGQHKNFKSKKC